MKFILTFLVLSTSLWGCAQNSVYNVDAEQINQSTKVPKGWQFGFNEQQRLAYTIQIDSLIKQSGKSSISIKSTNRSTGFAAIGYTINKVFSGSTVELRGYMKTEDVDSGYAGLWIRIDGKNGSIAFDNMQKKNVKGSTDWKPYSISLNYNAEAAKQIHIGGLLVGKGRVWFDKFELFIDGKPIDKVPVKVILLPKAELDTSYSNSSRIPQFKISPRVIINLKLAGQFWGFLKYYHPAIAKGDYNWDAELFRFLPQVINAKNNTELSSYLEKYLTNLPPVVGSKTKQHMDEKDIAIKPDYDQLFDQSVLSRSLIEKLIKVRDQAIISSNYYVSFVPGVGNPIFENEKPYSNMGYPDAGYRILSLYRYWAIINYFFPYKDVIGENWNEVLVTSLPEFINAKDRSEYTLACLKLIAKIHDTHANIWNNNASLNDFKGKYKLPFTASFIQNKLVVTGYHADTLNVKQKFLIGDVITRINGKTIEELNKQYLPYTAASNYDTQLRDLPGYYLLRANKDLFTLEIERANKKFRDSIIGLNANFYAEKVVPEDVQSFKLLSSDIGYVYPGKYKNSDLSAIKEKFKDTKGIIVDMRCYPSDFMPFTFGNYIKNTLSPFVKFTTGHLEQPGLFTYTAPLSNGEIYGSAYKGKIIVIVNSTSQSQAEYTTMAFQSSPNVSVIGSTTAGADGNVSSIALPGGISTMISGIGIFYPDGTATQGVGVKIDYVIKPTIKGTAAGNDELLEKAKKLLEN